MVGGEGVVEEVGGNGVVEVGNEVVEVGNGVVEVGIGVVEVDVVVDVVDVVVPSHGSQGLLRPHGSTQHSPSTGWIKKSIIP